MGRSDRPMQDSEAGKNFQRKGIRVCQAEVSSRIEGTKQRARLQPDRAPL